MAIGFHIPPAASGWTKKTWPLLTQNQRLKADRLLETGSHLKQLESRNQYKGRLAN